MHQIDDLFHSCLNDVCKIFNGDLFGRPVPQTRYRDNLIGLHLISKGSSEFYFQKLRLILKNHASLLDVGGNDVTSERDHSRMTKNIFMEYRDVGGAASDIHQGYACFFLIVF